MTVDKASRRVYFARVGDYIKIGFSIHPEQRIRKCRTVACPDDLADGPAELLGSIPGGVDREADVHGDLWEWRVDGEWFVASDVVLDYITHALETAA